MIFTILKERVRQARAFFRTDYAARVLTVAAFIGTIGFLVLGIYTLAVHAFRFILLFPDFVSALSLFSYELMFLVTGILSCVSVLIASIPRMFDRPFDVWFMASPRFRSALLLNASEVIFASLWPLLIIGIPTLAATRAVFHLSPLGALLSLIGLGAFGVLASVAGLSFVLGILWLSRLLSGKAHRAHAFYGIIAACIAAGALLLHMVREVGTVTRMVFESSGLTGAVSTDAIAGRFALSPTHPFAEVFLLAQQGATGAAWSALVGGLAYTLIPCLILLMLSRGFLKLWQDLQERTTEAATSVTRKVHHTRMRFGDQPLTALAKKELLALTRDTRTLAWFGFVLVLWVLQIGFDTLLRHDRFLRGTQISSLAAGIQAFQIVVIVYFISMFVLRFVFPSYSAERGTAWIIGTVPVTAARLFNARLFFYSTMLVGLAATVGLIHVLILGISLTTALVILGLIVFLVAVMVLFGLLLGLAFPNFHTSDPELLSTSLPGIGYTVASLVLGLLGAWVFRQYLLHNSLSVVLLFAAILFAGYVALLGIVKRQLGRFEFG
jgi:hypothetical protein